MTRSKLSSGGASPVQRFLLIALLLARTLIDSLFAEDKPAFDPAQFAEFEVLLTD